MAVLHPNTEEFNNLIQGGELVVADFFATWCGPCKMLAPIIEELAENNSEDVKIVKIDVDENEELAITYNIQAVPTLIFFKNGEENQRVTGIIPKQNIQQIIDNNK